MIGFCINSEKKNKKKKKARPNNDWKVRKDYTGMYTWIAYFIIAAVLYNFSKTAFLIFGGIILLSIIRRGWELGRERNRMKWF